MSTVVRPEINKKNKYYISRHRYYELKHFCFQYPEWKARYNELVGKLASPSLNDKVDGGEMTDETCDNAIELAKLSRWIKLVETATRETDDEIGNYIFKAVTEDRSFAYLKGVVGIPCEKDMYYDRYRKFFWLLSEERV